MNTKSNTFSYFLVEIVLLLLFPVLSFSQEYYITDNYLIRDICSMDLDLDGDNDLVVSSASYDGLDTLNVFFNDGMGNFEKYSIARNNGVFVLCGIIDDDQYPDIITNDGGNIFFIKNNGDGTFGEAVPVAPALGSKVVSYIADMDQDGLNDLVYTYNSYNTQWGILKNLGNLLFEDHIIYDDGLGGILFPSIGYFNDDSLPDVCLAYSSYGTHYLINQGNFIFDSTLICSTG